MDDRNNPLINAARGCNACGINHDELLGPLDVEIKELKEENENLKKVLRMIVIMNPHMAEQYMRHDYRSMWEIWEMVSEKVKSSPIY